MTDSNNGWGTLLGGGIVGYLLGSGGTLFGNNYPGYTGAGVQCDVARANARIDNVIAQNAQDAVLGAIAGVNSNVTGNAKDIYQLELQNLFAQQASDQSLNNQFCQVREYIMNDGIATRATINSFKDQYTQDRIADLSAENASLKTQLSIAPLYATVNGISNQLNSVMCNPSVRCCCSNTPVSGTVSF